LEFKERFSGISLDDISGSMDVHFFPSLFRGRVFGSEDETNEDANVHCVINQLQKSHKVLQVESPLADFNIKGEFDVH